MKAIFSIVICITFVSGHVFSEEFKNYMFIRGEWEKQPWTFRKQNMSSLPLTAVKTKYLSDNKDIPQVDNRQGTKQELFSYDSKSDSVLKLSFGIRISLVDFVCNDSVFLIQGVDEDNRYFWSITVSGEVINECSIAFPSASKEKGCRITNEYYYDDPTWFAGYAGTASNIYYVDTYINNYYEDSSCYGSSGLYIYDFVGNTIKKVADEVRMARWSAHHKSLLFAEICAAKSGITDYGSYNVDSEIVERIQDGRFWISSDGIHILDGFEDRVSNTPKILCIDGKINQKWKEIVDVLDIEYIRSGWMLGNKICFNVRGGDYLFNADANIINKCGGAIPLRAGYQSNTTEYVLVCDSTGEITEKRISDMEVVSLEELVAESPKNGKGIIED